MPEMNLWRLEWLRLRRTWRGIGLVALYLFFGLTGPVLARYLAEIVQRFGSGRAEIRFPDPVPVDGLLQYLSSSQQLGTIMVLAVAAGPLAVDASPDLATFLRTRVASPASIILRRYVVYAAASGAVFTLGTLAAWYQTVVLIGPLPAGAMIVGTLFGAAYYAYLVALLALAAGIVRGVVGAVLLTFVVVLLEPAVGLIGVLEPWLPAQLSMAVVSLVSEETTAAELLRPLAVAAMISALALWGAIRLSARREI